MHTGIWFYGLSGSGKTLASEISAQSHGNSFLIDGDIVRKHISFDLDFTISDRSIQIQRVFGLSQIVIGNGLFPICSTVIMTQEVLNKCTRSGLIVIEILRPKTQLIAARTIYRNNKNVVGVDIPQAKLDTHKIYNEGDETFKEKVLRYVE